MSVTFSVTIGNVTIERNHSYCRAADLMDHARLQLAPDGTGVVKHCELLPAINNLLDSNQKAKSAYKNCDIDSTEIPSASTEWFIYASEGLIGLFSLAYSKGMDVHYS